MKHVIPNFFLQKFYLPIYIGTGGISFINHSVILRRSTIVWIPDKIASGNLSGMTYFIFNR